MHETLCGGAPEFCAGALKYFSREHQCYQWEDLCGTCVPVLVSEKSET